MDAVSLKLARNYTNEKLNSLPSNRPTKTVSFDGGIYSVGNDMVNGQVSDVVIKGQTWTNLAGAGDTSPQTVENLDAAKTYLLINSEGANVTIDTDDTPTPVKLTGATSFDFVWASGKIALYELSAEETALDASVLGQKYHYVSDTKSTNSVRVKSVGKNLFDGELESGVYDSITGIKTAYVGYIRSANKLIIKPSTSYKISSDKSSYEFVVSEWDVNSNYIGRLDAGASGEFTTSSSAHRITIGTKSSGMDETSTLIQIEEGVTATTYEPYKESIVNVNLPEPLRSLPNGVKDEVNVTKGIKTQGVSDEEIINGNNVTWSGIEDLGNGYYRAYSSAGWSTNKNILLKTVDSGKGYCADGDFNILAGAPTSSRSISFHTNTILYLGVEASKIDALAGATTLDKFKAYINLYPITLTYQLAEPIVTKLPAQAPLQVFENGTIYVEPIGALEETTLPTVEIEVPTGNSNQYGVATHDYQAAAADWVLSSNEAKCMLLKTTNAGAAVNIIAPDRPGVLYAVNNTSGQAVTVKIAGGTGVSITDAKTAIVMHNGTNFIKITEEV